MKSKRLHLGCGNNIKEGYINIDIANLKGVDIIQDLEKFPYPFEDNEISEVYTQHTLEHLNDLVKVMEELHRICKNGAKIKIIVPYFSGQGAFNDPTHKRFFTYKTFEYFEGGYYSSARFKIKKRKIFFLSSRKFMKSNKLSSIFDILINLAPIFYQRLFSFTVPSSEVHFLLEVKK